MAKINYNKEKTGRILGGSGPRDIQLRQRLLHQEVIKRDVEDTRPTMVIEDMPKMQKVDLSQYLPLKKVKQKIDEAVKFTVNKYEEILNDLKNQLKIKDSELDKVRSELLMKEELLKIKEDIYTNLQVKMDKIYNRISDGSIQSFVGKNRPELEDGIFIDPLEKSDNQSLDSHIDIREEKEASDRDMKGDLNKLRSLLKK